MINLTNKLQELSRLLKEKTIRWGLRPKKLM